MSKFISRSSSKGFTLIELLTVIAIIGILTAIVVVSVTPARMKTRDARRMADLSSVKTAIELYYEANKSYPKTTGIGDFCPMPEHPDWTGMYVWGKSYECPTNWIPGISSFISVLPTDPIKATVYENMYSYWYYSDGNNYKIFARRMESSVGKDKAINDGGTRNVCTTPDICAYELFTSGGQGF